MGGVILILYWVSLMNAIQGLVMGEIVIPLTLKQSQSPESIEVFPNSSWAEKSS